MPGWRILQIFHGSFPDSVLQRLWHCRISIISIQLTVEREWKSTNSWTFSHRESKSDWVFRKCSSYPVFSMIILNKSATDVPFSSAYYRSRLEELTLWAALLNFLITPTKLARFFLTAGFRPRGSWSPSVILSQSSIGGIFSFLAAAKISETD